MLINPIFDPITKIVYWNDYMYDLSNCNYTGYSSVKKNVAEFWGRNNLELQINNGYALIKTWLIDGKIYIRIRDLTNKKEYMDFVEYNKENNTISPFNIDLFKKIAKPIIDEK